MLGKIFVTSDLHFCHDRAFMYEPRGFKSIEEHDAAIIENWNKVVADNDTVYLLGDLMLNDNEKAMNYIRQLKGRIYVVIGNHDTPARIELYRSLPNVVEVAYAMQIKYGKQHFYLSHYPTITGEINKRKPLQQLLINLYGHTHQKTKFYNDIRFMYHVGLDSHNNTPVLIDQIIEDCRLKNNNQP